MTTVHFFKDTLSSPILQLRMEHLPHAGETVVIVSGQDRGKWTVKRVQWILDGRNEVEILLEWSEPL